MALMITFGSLGEITVDDESLVQHLVQQDVKVCFVDKISNPLLHIPETMLLMEV